MTDLQRAITGIAKAQEKSGYDRGYEDGLKAAQDNIEAQHSSASPVQQINEAISQIKDVLAKCYLAQKRGIKT